MPALNIHPIVTHAVSKEEFSSAFFAALRDKMLFWIDSDAYPRRFCPGLRDFFFPSFFPFFPIFG